MSTSHGSFVWYELMTTDAEAATGFYGAVVGWEAADSGMPDVRYTLLHVGDTAVAGLMAMPEPIRASGVPPHWGGYIAVDDVDADAGRLTLAGGEVHRAPSDIPGVGRFAVVADPQGAVFTLFKPAESPSRPPVPPDAEGNAGWRELHALDWTTVFPFYEGLFGWTKGTAIDMGPMGTYQLFDKDGVSMGGMMTRTEERGKPSWLFYFNTADVDAASQRVTSRGGQVLMGPTEVPGGMWIIQCRDPQGAMFAMVGARAK